ncbi:MAG: EAL domain-containing protein, partial [Geodermatophilaceae bacterium]|nr:EAL domain-containing protein [Geodermatophilaceae bacterium]
LGVSPISVEAASTGHDPASVLREANQALHQAKRRGKGRVEIFDSALRNDAAQRLRDETDLEQAISTGQFALHYQPIIDLNTAELTGAEALVRWHRPNHGMILPTHFIPLAEESGLIVDLGRWLLRRACTDAAQWSRTAPALADSTVSVNVSARQLIHPRFTHDVRAALLDADLPAHRLSLEVTESILIEETDPTVAILTALRADGVRIALDDFGTGYSSLSYLQRLPVDTLKIDKSFIAPIRGPAEGTALSEVVLKLAQALDLRTVAEGVETTAQATALRQMGCEWAQGFALAPPVPLAELEAACETATRAVLSRPQR